MLPLCGLTGCRLELAQCAVGVPCLFSPSGVPRGEAALLSVLRSTSGVPTRAALALAASLPGAPARPLQPLLLSVPNDAQESQQRSLVQFLRRLEVLSLFSSSLSGPCSPESLLKPFAQAAFHPRTPTLGRVRPEASPPCPPPHPSLFPLQKRSVRAFPLVGPCCYFLGSRGPLQQRPQHL